MTGPPVLRGGGTVTLPADTHLDIRDVPLHEVSLPDNHCAMDVEHVQALTAILRTGSGLPPPLLLEHDHGFWVIEGRHRFLAHAAAGRDHIRAVVTDRIVVVCRPALVVTERVSDTPWSED